MNTCTDINWFQILCFSLVVLLGVSVPASGSLYPHGVVLISWDGVSKSILLDLLEKNSLPNLSSLVKKGSFVNISITDHYPDTMAGHAQILTGYSPEQTGVFKSMRYGEIPEGLTIFERLEDAFGPENISTVIVASQERSLGTVKGLPFFHAGNVVDYYYDRNSDAGLVGSVASEAIYHYAPKGRYFIFVHFRDAADSGHAYGAGLPAQMAAIKKIDDATGMILNALENLDLDEKTTVLITTDHGVDTGSHALTDENSVWMITNEQGYCQAGDQKDIVPTILKRMGLEYTNIKPAYPGKSLF